MGRSTKRWSYSAGERGRNRVRAFEHASGVLMLEFYEVRHGYGQPTRKRISLGHRDKAKAKAQADEAAAKLATAEPIRSEALTLKALFDIYLDEVTPQKAPSTRLHDKRAANLFISCFGAERKVSELNRRDWDRFIRERTTARLRPPASKHESVGPRTVARDLKWLLAVLNWALLAGDGRGGVLLERNPLKGLKVPKEESPKRPVLTHDRYEAMLAVADKVDWRFKLALVLAHETGHRIGAIRRLRWSDIDLERGVIRWPKQTDKMGFEHEAYLSEAALEALGAALGRNPCIGDSWVFPAPGASTKSCSRHLVRDWWYRAEGLAGLERVEGLGWHGLRRKFATELKEVPLPDLCQLGGWRSGETLIECYQQPDAKTQREALRSRKELRAEQPSVRTDTTNRHNGPQQGAKGNPA